MPANTGVADPHRMEFRTCDKCGLTWLSRSDNNDPCPSCSEELVTFVVLDTGKKDE
jgi:DNA-directed RNA polymerase subunit M/transcription elongation factor TFIIS